MDVKKENFSTTFWVYIKEDYGDLYIAIQSLEDIYRIPIVLKYLQGFPEKGYLMNL